MDRVYFDKMNKNKSLPSDPYEHAGDLLRTEQDDLITKKEEEIKAEFSRMVEKQILLSTISDNALMRLIQNDAHILTSMLMMAVNDETYIPVFFKCYHSWRTELMLTRTKDGTERKLQATPGGYQPGTLGSYEMPINETEQKFFDKILGKKGGNEQQQQPNQNTNKWG